MEKNNKKVLFRQIPTYSSSEKFEITANELNMMVKMAELSSEFIPVFESMVSRFLDNGQMSIRYEDMSGKKLTKKQIEKILKSEIDVINNNTTSEDIEPQL